MKSVRTTIGIRRVTGIRAALGIRHAIAAVAIGCALVALSPAAGLAAAPPDSGPGQTVPVDPATTDPATTETVTADTSPLDESQGGGAEPAVPESTSPIVISGEGGAPVPVPDAVPSAPLVQIPNGCVAPPLASVVFVGTLVAKVPGIARFRVEQVRAGSADGYVLSNLIDISYDNETQYLTLDERYLVGAAPTGTSRTLSSKVRESEPLFGGNAVIGLTEKNLSCPTIEDPVRTLHIDGTEVEASMLSGFADDKRGIAMAFLKPIAAAFGIVLALVAVRWLFTLIFAAFRHAAHAGLGDDVDRGRRRIS